MTWNRNGGRASSRDRLGCGIHPLRTLRRSDAVESVCTRNHPGIFGVIRARLQNGRLLVRRIIKCLPGSIAVAALVSVAAAGCGTTASGTSPKPAPDTQAGFPGYKWQVVEIDHAGKETPIPARDADYLMFAPNGQFGATEPVNSHGGLYHQTGDSFTTSDMSSTSVGYTSNDPVALLAIDAIDAFGDGVQAKVQLTGNRLAVTVGGYLLICQRDGRQANFPGPSPAGVSPPSAATARG
jgi:hypothetical protein